MTETLAETTPHSDEPIPAYPMPRASGCPFDPPPAAQALHDELPVAKVRMWDGSTPWLVTRYGDGRALLADPRVSSQSTLPGFPHPNAGFRENAERRRSFIAMDDPEHARIRRMVTAPFAIKRVEALRPSIQKITDELIDGMLAGPNSADLVSALALPLPSLVICTLLGVPYEDHEFFQEKSSLMINRYSSAEDMIGASDALTDYLDELIGVKLAEPADDMLSELATRVGSGELTRREAASMGVLLLIAGHETTANMIALGTVALLENPDQLAVLRETDDPKVVAKAVEELLRYLTIVHNGRGRVALEDIEVGDATIRAGDGIIIYTGTGNRDPELFPEPDRLDIGRDARRHMAFGFGVHQCLGQPLARVELQVVYGTLYRRIPTLRLATGAGQLPYKHDGLVYGVYELPVTWDA
ncbi:cytochrome P450-SU2 [Streptomyces himastatinicus ATCC 53653]|uniref:Cytochrome P450-SU2 n=1 Tax=Streptomyces himastatinicus ATCC 53653 TaxID=457427 RepID=D9WW78_9ACTN|nr:cytochrome P450 [Streptomyces himastatinicus]EFL26534.1 cytochrome P450-SU2 [Streptomyces himastatinicus ATCC 53653]